MRNNSLQIDRYVYFVDYIRSTFKRPASISFGYLFGERKCYDQNEEWIGTLTSEKLDSFRYYVEKPFYI